MSHQPSVSGVVSVDGPHDRRGILGGVVVAARRCGARPRRADAVVVHGVARISSPSSAPHCARVMMLGGWPGAITAIGGVHWVSTGRLRWADQHRGKILRQWLFGVGRDVAEAVPTVYRTAGAAVVTGASAGRVTAICTDVVVPTKTGSVPRGPCAAAVALVVSVGFQRLGVVPGSPTAVGPSGADPRRRAGEVVAGERDHRERGASG